MSRHRLAVVGSGVAGLTAGYVLSRTDDVTLFEADDRLGGHAHTHRVQSGADYALRSCSAQEQLVQVSYYLNRLQRLPARQDYVVTLNPDREPAAGRVLARMSYEHPLYDPAALAAQRRLPGLNDGVTAYAGAYHGRGFHEDGCRAGLAAAQSLGGHW